MLSLVYNYMLMLQDCCRWSHGTVFFLYNAPFEKKICGSKTLWFAKFSHTTALKNSYRLTVHDAKLHHTSLIVLSTTDLKNFRFVLTKRAGACVFFLWLSASALL
ncbi:unnamed protein product [Clavelina lepadiformis]|uniref:Uncharacterized protein n=1 Tax=Clavelina lepadiformis TaxID=159417 RepID=A0ABP0H484_CLALP